MPGKPRSEIVDAGEVGFYHCISRCVRRAFFCGEDPVSGKNFDHRKDWVRRRLAVLAEIFAIDVAAYAVLSNHIHLVLRIRPDRVEGWSAEEVAERCLRLSFEGATEKRVAALSRNAERIAELRERLCSLSWFMRYLNKHIADRANREEKIEGSFFDGRFTSQKLEDEAAVLACAMYVDLNPIRAQIAETIEDSDYTSAQQRIVQRKAKTPREKKTLAQQMGLVPIPLCPVSETEGGFAPLTLEEYLALLDAVARQFNRDASKRGRTPSHLAPILNRLGISDDTLSSYAHRFSKQPRVRLNC